MTKAPDGTDTGWGSHQPALRALARFKKIDSVIEFGAGLYSTHLFLDRDAFPDLTSLVTFEHESVWAEKVRVNDKRHKLIIVPPKDFITDSQDMKADFVFVDSAPQSTRKPLLSHALILAPIVGIHDSRIENVSHLECKYVKAFNDKIQTVFASNTLDLSELELEE